MGERQVTVPVMSRMPAEVEERLARRARSLGWSRSRLVARLVEAAVADDEAETIAAGMEGVEVR